MYIDKELNLDFKDYNYDPLLMIDIQDDIQDDINFLFSSLGVSKVEAEELLQHCENNIEKIVQEDNYLGISLNDEWLDCIEFEILAYRLIKLDKCNLNVAYYVLKDKISKIYDKFKIDKKIFEKMILLLSKIIPDITEITEDIGDRCFIQDCINIVEYEECVAKGNFVRAYWIFKRIMKNIILNEFEYFEENNKEEYKKWFRIKFETFVLIAIAADKLEDLDEFFTAISEKAKIRNLRNIDIEEMRLKINVEKFLVCSMSKHNIEEVNNLIKYFENYRLIDQEYNDNYRLDILVLYMRFLEKMIRETYYEDTNYYKICCKLLEVSNKVNQIYELNYIDVYRRFSHLISYMKNSSDIAKISNLYLCKFKPELLENFLKQIKGKWCNSYIINRVFRPLSSFYFDKCWQESADAIHIEKVILEFIKLYMDITYTEEILKVTDYKEKVFSYYTTLETFSYILFDNNKYEKNDIKKGEINKYKLKIMNSGYMNDPNEGNVFYDILRSCEEYKSNIYNILLDNNDKKIRKQYNNVLVFLKSFSNKIDKLTMWSEYGDKGKGCCVVVDGETFRACNIKTSLQNNKFKYINKINDDYNLFNVAYWNNNDQIFIINGEKNDEVKNMIMKISKDINDICKEATFVISHLGENNQFKFKVNEMMNYVLSRLCYLIKYDEYQDENEVRLVFQRDVKNSNDIIEIENSKDKLQSLLCLDYPMRILIKEVILGPKVEECDNYAPFITMKLAEINEGCEYESKLTNSAIDYR